MSETARTKARSGWCQENWEAGRGSWALGLLSSLPGCRRGEAEARAAVGLGCARAALRGAGGHCCDRATHSKLARGDEGPQQAEGPVHSGSSDGSLGRESQRGAPLRPQRGAAPANSEA